MDAVMDLTARAVSLLTFIQDTFLRASVQPGSIQPPQNINDVSYDQKFPEEFSHDLNHIFRHDFSVLFANSIHAVKAHEKLINIKNGQEPDSDIRPIAIESKMLELVWFSGKSPDTEDKQLVESYLIELCASLVNWIKINDAVITQKVGLRGAFAPPYLWREAISEIVYLNRPQRVALAETLEYLPIHIVLAMGGAKYEANEQRILQWWQTNKKEHKIVLTETEAKLHDGFKKFSYQSFHKDVNSTAGTEVMNDFYTEKIVYLLSHYRDLTRRLLECNAPLPFEYIFNDELDEIKKTRKLRNKEQLTENDPGDEQLSSLPDDGYGNDTIIPTGNTYEDDRPTQYSCDPFIRGKDMKLFALAFSGGGIRSATFNLGILQGLAKKGVISHVDYLSTVSGGGYIGSWLATWIKRDGSVKKITDRLNPEKSQDPLGEEVRPIRWLRMFSNYFTPNKSIMSLDSWTVGVTWLRNTLLNQVVIFLMLLSILLLVRSLYEVWFFNTVWLNYFKSSYVYITACLLLFILAFFTGIGMQWYNRGRSQSLPFDLHSINRITAIILIIALGGSYIVSASLFSQELSSFNNKLNVLWPAGIVAFIILIIIAVFGRYDKCIVSFGKSKYRAIFIIFYTALIAAGMGWVFLAAGWKLFELIKIGFAGYPGLKTEALAFTAGLPIILVVFGITVVTRMALLGKYFPDERREWWGRMGAVINRLVFIWILVSASTFLLRPVINTFLTSWSTAPVTLGGWLALVGGTVKAAFSSKTGKEGGKGFQSMALDILSKAGPYLFALGLLVFLPALIEPIMSKKFLPGVIELRPYFKALLLALAFFLPALFLSWRLGVNEFSMHHFYKNRLVRAYLGATRRKSSRDKTSNPFTSFDKLDDEKLFKFKHEQGYFGPYPLLNTALNASQVSDLSRQDRKAESFIFSPLYCGFDFSKVRPSVNTLLKSYDYGYRPTQQYGYSKDNGPGIGTAMAISGAAVNPNQGYHSSAATAFLLTVFNVQMGWWIGNPRKSKWQQSDPNFGLAYIFYNLTGQTNTSNDFVCLSDGGHFDNMGLYEMVRRRCSFIILGDGEQDENFTCEGFANAIRKCRIDFGAEIMISVDGIAKKENRYSKNHYATGTIKYSGDKKATGTILYIKSSITGNEPVDVREYTLKNPTFPQQTTADQFFDEGQFESYRKLGMYIADLAMSDKAVIKALQLNLKANADNSVRDAIEKPVKNLFNTLKDFFRKRE